MDELNRPRPPATVRVLFFGFAFLLYVPLAVLVLQSFRGPDGWTLEWFAKVYANPFWGDALRRSLGLGALAAALSTLIGSTAALGFRFRPSRAVDLFSVVAFVMPELVFALSLLSWFASVKLELGFATMLAAHITFSLSFAFFVFRSRLEKMEVSLEEAALDLGATPWQVLRRVHLPLLGPTFISCFLICFLLSFDDFLISYFVSGMGWDTLPMKLYFSMKAGLTPELNALAALMAALSGTAIYLLSLIFQRSSSR